MAAAAEPGHWVEALPCPRRMRDATMRAGSSFGFIGSLQANELILGDHGIGSWVRAVSGAANAPSDRSATVGQCRLCVAPRTFGAAARMTLSGLA
jgi:hypothetical protein